MLTLTKKLETSQPLPKGSSQAGLGLPTKRTTLSGSGPPDDPVVVETDVPVGSGAGISEWSIAMAAPLPGPAPPPPPLGTPVDVEVTSLGPPLVQGPTLQSPPPELVPVGSPPPSPMSDAPPPFTELEHATTRAHEAKIPTPSAARSESVFMARLPSRGRARGNIASFGAEIGARRGGRAADGPAARHRGTGG